MSIIGLNFSHDSSAALLQEDGAVIAAVEEERINRRKGSYGLPPGSMAWCLRQSEKDPISEIIVGSHATMSGRYARRLLAAQQGSPSNPPGSFEQPAPGCRDSSEAPRDGHRLIEKWIREQVRLAGEDDNVPIQWVNHHDAHLGCAAGVSLGSPTLLMSLDSAGDFESGAIAIHDGSGKLHSLARISHLDSLGALYSAVTKRYNFKSARHEGKITGLAAFGSYSAAVDILLGHVEVSEGRPRIKLPGRFRRELVRILREVGVGRSLRITMDELADAASDATSSYADLAFAIQEVLEASVLEICSYWRGQTGLHSVAVAGGVFANVKLNQRLSEQPGVTSVLVYPNMGDGGIAVGGVWSALAQRGALTEGVGLHSPFLGPASNTDLPLTTPMDLEGLSASVLRASEVSSRVAQDVASGLVVGLHQGKLEWGPRALGNRSILLDPRMADAVSRVNERLRRTEFMPFAPMVLDTEFEHYFETSNESLQPFFYMAMTCRVRDSVCSLIPAVTHIDRTARPQIVTQRSNPLAYEVLLRFRELTGIGLLVNTSFNVHEEPINNELNDSLSALRRQAVDVVYTESVRYSQTTITKTGA